MKPFLLIICTVLFGTFPAFSQHVVHGIVISHSNGKPLPGVSIKPEGEEHTYVSNEKGEFSLPVQALPQKLHFSFIGFKEKWLTIDREAFCRIALDELSNELEEVVINTGYQKVPAERSTGSFVQLNNEILNRRVGTNILERLEDVTPGLVFNRGKLSSGSISIRGRNTIYGDAAPLIVIDNFPYEGSMDNINPNDVESITVLKDAAAASIWGARAGNGVIVITTRRGRLNQPAKINLTATTSMSEKPDIFYQQRMSSADFIEMEKTLFSKNFYNSKYNSGSNPALTPVVDLLYEAKNNAALTDSVNRAIEALKQYDVRDDLQNYFYRKASLQQYNLNISGEGINHTYILSGGYDHSLSELVNNGYDRLTLNTSNGISLIRNKLNVLFNTYFTQSRNDENNPGAGTIGLRTGDGPSLYPYARLTDDNGNALAINHDYRSGFLEQARQDGLLDWSYRPLEEIYLADNSTSIKDYRINTSLDYRILPYLNMEVLYQYNGTDTKVKDYQAEDSYFTRDLINRFSYFNSANVLQRPIPAGGILDLQNSSFRSHSVRGQLNFKRTWNSIHELNMIGGYELRDYHTLMYTNRMYGYDNEHAIASQVDYRSVYEQYYYKGYSLNIPFYDGSKDLTDRYVSWYANGAYTLNGRYTLSVSVRFDQSNLFGVNANQKGVPLYSFGSSWEISRENFYPFSDVLPYLKIRATYGYNGNINKSLSAYTTATYLSGNAINQTYAEIRNPPNPELKWERVRMINLGIDFASRNNRITGSAEPYFKRGQDLIGDIAYAPSTGITTFRGNTANSSGHGIDFTLNTVNTNRGIKWNTTFLFSYATDKVKDYELKQAASYYARYAETSLYPMEGRPLYALYSYRWAGLDPQTGDPQGYLNGEVSKNYSGIVNDASPDNLIYHGPARPTTFGALRNTISWRGFSLSANISFRMGYYYRNQGFSSYSVLSGEGYYEGNYAKRWQKPGDELHTTIPALPASRNSNRDNFYNYSEITVAKGDHIRWQDARLGYDLGKQILQRSPFSKAGIYFYANNLGLLWKASKESIDPDYPISDYVPMRTYSLGLNLTFK